MRISALALALSAGLLGGNMASAEQAVRNPHVRQGLEITARGDTVVVAPGECEVGGRVVKVPAAVTLAVPPAPIRQVTNEALRLSVDKPAGYAKGTRFKGPNARDVNARGALVPDSVEIRRAPGGEILKQGEDYLLDADWGHVGLGPQSRVTAQDTVFASYRYSLQRMDTIQVGPDGKLSLLLGEPHISAPVPPAPEPGCLALAHVFTPYRATTVTPEQIWVIAETPEQAPTGSTPGRIPKTLAKLRAGEPVKIVCWGDSVTAGGNASVPALRYVDVFAAGLKERFPKARIEVENISVGGSSSRQWLDSDPADLQNPRRFQRVLDAKPDLVSIEFVNDAYMDAARVEATYSEILKRLNGAEVILITPHFTMMPMMGFRTMKEAERRPYVLALRAFAERHGIALADASARWEHLWKEGLPYLTLLHNTINHPDDRGHRLFAEELWKCFR